MRHAVGRIAIIAFAVTCLIFDVATCLLALMIAWGVQ